MSAEVIGPGDIEKVGAHGPLVATFAGGVASAGSLEEHAVGVITEFTNLLDFGFTQMNDGEVGHFIDLTFDAAGVLAGFLDEGWDDAFDRGVGEVPVGGILQWG